MRVLYGVNGEGLGHATRSGVVIDMLLGRGHEVRVVASGRAFRYLSERLTDVEEIFGPSFAMDEGEIRRWATLRGNLAAAPRELQDTVRHWLSVVHDWRPDAVVTDFEPLSALYARSHHVPLVSVDNIHMLVRCHHDEAIVGAQPADFILARAITRGMIPTAGDYVVTTFFRPRILWGRTTLVPPIVRPEVVAAIPSRGEHVLVYSQRRAWPDRRAPRRRCAGARVRHARHSLERHLPRRPADRARGDHRRRLLAPERGDLPGQAGALRCRCTASSSSS